MISNNKKIICLSIIISLFKPWAHAELYTSVAEMEPLLKTLKRIIDDLDDYITKEEERLAVLKDHLERFKVEHEKAMEDIPNYLGNPINAFTLIKRLTTNLDEIDTFIKNGTVSMVTLEYFKNISMIRGNLKFPTLEDLNGAIQALTRLQVTYNLDVHDMAEGRLNGVAYTYPMTAADCFELCKDLYFQKDYKNSLPWSMESLRKYREESDKKHSFTEADLLEYIAFTHYLTHDVKTALEWTNKLLELEPNHPRAAGNVPLYEDIIARQVKTNKELGDRNVKISDDAKTKPVKDIDDTSIYPDVKERYEALCRGEIEINRDVAKRLFCRYMSETHPFLRLAPIKAEQVYIDPDVFLFHGVLSDYEIRFIKFLSMPRLKRAVIHDATGNISVANYRISKSAWLRDEESPVVARVSQRVADMTGLSMTSAEQLQVVNYGIGGQYEPHYDYSRKTEVIFSGLDGNRIATLLFYMSDVVQGGATVFTNLGLSVFPARGTALFFTNLHPSGEGDTATRHAACPVLRGSKWVCNKWIHEAGQEFIKPCNLKYQREEMIRKSPRPYRKRRDRVLQFGHS